jgi:hypothetical protein
MIFFLSTSIRSCDANNRVFSSSDLFDLFLSIKTSPLIRCRHRRLTWKNMCFWTELKEKPQWSRPTVVLFAAIKTKRTAAFEKQSVPEGNFDEDHLSTSRGQTNEQPTEDGRRAEISH